MIKLLSLLIILFAAGCSSSTENPKLKTRPNYQVKVKFEDHKLKAAGEWLGGTEENPKYYTEQGEEIITPVFGVDIVPVTKRSIGPNGKVVYPHFGFEVIGDLRKEHYLALIEKIKEVNFDRSTYKPPIIVADSNFLEKGAVVKHSTGKVFGFYEYKLLNWQKKK